jgi:hypothetical protein
MELNLTALHLIFCFNISDNNNEPTAFYSAVV